MADALPDGPDGGFDYARTLGEQLLQQGYLLPFDPESGALVHANDQTIFLLELSEDGLSAYDFQTICDTDGESASDLWFELVAGARAEWTGSIKAILSGTCTPMRFMSALAGPDGGPQQVLLRGTKIEESAAAGEDTGVFAGMNDYLGVVEYDAEGKVIAANERAEMALEFFSGDLVGSSLEKIWPAEEVNKPEYVEFWEKLRQGRIVEGRFPHKTGEGNEIWLQSTFVPIKTADGMLGSIKQCVMDVTDATVPAERNARMLEALKTSLNYAEYDLEGHFLDANEAMIELFGTKRGDAILGRHASRFIEPEFKRNEGYQRNWELACDGNPTSGDILHARDDGRAFWTFSNFLPVKGANGKTERVIEIAFDIDKDRRALEGLRMRYTLVNETVGMLELTSTGKVEVVNKRFLEDTGFLEEDVLGKEYVSLVPHDQQHTTEFRDFWDGLVAGNVVSGDFRRVGANGAEIWFRSVYAPLRAEDDRRVRRILCMTQNITDQKRRDSENAGKLKAFEGIVNTAEYAPDGTLVTASQGFLDEFGYQLEEVQNKDHALFCTSEFAESDSHSLLWQRLREGEEIKNEDRRITNAQEQIWLALNYAPLKDHSGRVQKIVEFSRNVTERRVAMQALDARMKAVDTIFAAIEFDLGGKVCKVNEGCLRLTGYSERELLDIHHSALCDSSEVVTQDYRDMWLDFSKGETRSGLFFLRGRGEREIYVLGNYAPIHDVLGEVSGVAFYATDVTEFVQFRKAALQSSKDGLTQIQTLKSALGEDEAELASLAETLTASCRSMAHGEAKLEAGMGNFQDMRESVQQIQHTVTTVSEIATQTNLLAFNAAIEAARVGENGEGFSIVADEVRRLAERNSTAAKEILQQITMISERMDNGSTNSKQAADAIKDGAQSLVALQDSLDATSARLNQEAAAAQEAERYVEVIRDGAAA